jgi:phytoene synthase
LTALSALRDLDFERHVSALFAPSQHREAFAALAAYHCEIARIPFLVSEPLPGEIRLQWWRDVLAGGRAGEAAGHPVAGPLAHAMTAHGLPQQALDMMAEARIFDLYHDPMPDMASLEGWIGETHAALIQCQAMVLDADAAPGAGEACGHAGMVTGLAGVLRALPAHMARGQWFIPGDVIAAAGSSREALADERGGSARAAVVALLCAKAQAHVTSFRAAARMLPHTLRAAFLPVASARASISLAEKRGADVFIQGCSIRPLKAQWLITKAALSGF